MFPFKDIMLLDKPTTHYVVRRSTITPHAIVGVLRSHVFGDTGYYSMSLRELPSVCSHSLFSMTYLLYNILAVQRHEVRLLNSVIYHM